MIINIKSGDSILLIDTEDIYYITKKDQNVLIKLKNKSVEYRDNLYSISNILDKSIFF